MSEVAALRRSLSRRTWAFSGLTGAIALFSSVSAVRPAPTPQVSLLPSVIEAEKFVVKDRSGVVRATLGRTGHPTDDRHAETGLQLWTDGKQRGAFVVNSHGIGILSCSNSNEDVRLELAGEMDGGMTLYDAKGDQRIDLSLADDGSPIFVMNAKDLRARLQMGVHGGGDESGFITAYDKKEEDHPLLGKDGVPLIPLPTP